MEKLPCINQNVCPLADTRRGCFEDVHHLYWPQNRYRTQLEKEFRELDENKVRICRAEHNELHDVRPPEHPFHEEMRAAVALSNLIMKGVE